MSESRRGVEPIALERVTVYGDEESEASSVRLADVTIAVHPGEWIYVVGANGSGKSTLARLLAGLQPERMDGALRRGFAGEGASPIVLQQPRSQLFGETPREEAMFALEWRGAAAERIPELAERALRRVGLEALADEPWERLSGGQQQLAAIAAATAAGDAPLVALDEASSMLDEANREALVRVARDLHKRGTAIVWVTQRLDELEPDARIVAVRDGRVVFDGPGRAFLYGPPARGRGQADGAQAEPRYAANAPGGADSVSAEAAGREEALGDGSLGAPADPAGPGTGPASNSVPGSLSPLSPCLRAGLRLPYMAALAMELRRLGKLSDPLPMTAEEWRKVWGSVEETAAEPRVEVG
ncbi:energy-coupling factor ABC transporter ATP-binding protein [Paenibacillaceae bacterium WGS1546]|uniref:energy-coupling factor ABC transporter ATP-binding protein n=1 Tax=Cohnella sp. WGS1546 TaxID=3366810 RepID=UPI00372D38C3